MTRSKYCRIINIPNDDKYRCIDCVAYTLYPDSYRHTEVDHVWFVGQLNGQWTSGDVVAPQLGTLPGLH